MMERILVLAPHTDDGEIGCGATLSKYIEEGKKVFYVAFSACEESLPKGFKKDALRIEVQKATKELGISSENLRVLHYPVRKFSYCRQDILEDILNIKKEINPNMVFLPSNDDIHQDHEVITKEGIRAFKNINILGYELPWNNLSFKNTCFSRIEKKHLEKKINAISCYKSQENRTYINKEFITSLARIRGTQIQVEFAECFEIIRWVL